MGTSWVGLGEIGFWLNDGYCELLLHLLAKEVDKRVEPPEWMRKAQEHWRIWSTMKAVGCIDTGLDTFITCPERKQDLLTLVTSLQQSVRGRTEPLSKESAQRPNIRRPYQFVGNIPKEWFLQAVDALASLLRGDLKSTPETSSRLPVR